MRKPRRARPRLAFAAVLLALLSACGSDTPERRWLEPVSVRDHASQPSLAANSRDDIRVVGEARSAAEALSVARATAPDVIVLDYRLPDADERILVRYEPHGESLDPMPVSITPATFILLATWGWDEPALRQVVNSPAAYIGLVASARKSIIIFRDLMKEGISPDVLARVRVPTGLDLGAETPSEIALSILAEMLMVQRGAAGMPLAQSKGSAVMRASGPQSSDTPLFIPVARSAWIVRGSLAPGSAKGLKSGTYPKASVNWLRPGVGPAVVANWRAAPLGEFFINWNWSLRL